MLFRHLNCHLKKLPVTYHRLVVLKMGIVGISKALTIQPTGLLCHHQKVGSKLAFKPMILINVVIQLT
jgi:hypothetical protein